MWLLRLTAGKPEKIRDGNTIDDEMKVVRCGSWTLFDNLPKGMDPEGGHGVLCKEIKSEKEAKAHIAHTKARIEQEGRAGAEYHKRVLAKIERQQRKGEKPKEDPKPETVVKRDPSGAAAIREVEGK